MRFQNTATLASLALSVTISAVVVGDRYLFTNQDTMRAIALNEARRISRVSGLELAKAERTAWLIADRFFANHADYGRLRSVPRKYTNDMVFEALLMIDRISCRDLYKGSILPLLKQRGEFSWRSIPFEHQPFSALTYELYLTTKNNNYLDSFIAESITLFEKALRSQDGAVLVADKNSIRPAMLLDYMQQYSARMARLGHHTNDETYFAEALDQFKIYRSILRDPESGLWSQGRGWIEDDPTALSPGAWSRGHGWLMWGMIETLRFLPRHSKYFEELRKMYLELVGTLISLQSDGGLWRQLLDLPEEDSFIDSSGSALIAYSIARALDSEVIAGREFIASLRKAFRGLHQNVAANGMVLNVSRGPGPLKTIDNWYQTPGQTNDEHGAPTMLFGLAGELLLAKNRNDACGDRSSQLKIE